MISADQFKEAAWNSDFDSVKTYVEEGGNVNACGNNGVGALVTFNIEILEYLYNHGADPSIIWDDGSPAIGFHAWEVSVESLKWFLDKGVDPNLTNTATAESCLHSLCAKPRDLDRRLIAIQLLVAAGSEVNQKSKVGVETGSFMRDVCVVGETALHRAAAYQSQESIEFLLDSGADKSLLDARGESALSWASRHWRDRSVLKLLLYGNFENSIM